MDANNTPLLNDYSLTSAIEFSIMAGKTSQEDFKAIFDRIATSNWMTTEGYRSNKDLANNAVTL